MRRHDERPQEATDVNIRAIVIAVAAVALMLVAAAVVSSWLLRLYGAPLEQTPPVTPPAVRLDPEPVASMDAYRREKQALLSRYGWIDREAQIARIPVERAIDLLSKPASGS